MTRLGRVAVALTTAAMVVVSATQVPIGTAWAQAPETTAPVELPPEEVPVDLAPEEVPADAGADYGIGSSQLTALLNEGLELLDDERYLDASLRFNDIVNNGNDSLPVVQEGQFALAVSLFELGLYQSALLQFEAIVDLGSAHAKYRETVPYLLRISRRTVGDENIRSRIAQFPPEFYPAKLADEIHFLVGQYFYAMGSYDDALARFQLVSEKNGDFFVRARYLEGVIHIQASGLAEDPESADLSRLSEAAKSLKSVLRFRRDSGGSETADKVAAMANLALGRLFFSTRQYQVAVQYYDRVSEDDPDWLQSMFEVSWVYFQLKKYGRSLGNLHTLNSPFFSDQYFPESRVLQALILFYNCRYDEANLVIKTFVQDYYPLMTELQDEVNRIADPNAFYAWLARLSRAEQTDFSARFKRIFNAALADRRLRRKFIFVKALNDELVTLEKQIAVNPVAGPFLDALRGELRAYRSLVVGEAGGLAQARLLRVLKELKRHLAGALKIKGETLKAQRGMLAETIRAEQTAAASARTEYTVDAEHIEWPFSGEYWRDELGSYLYDISSTCAVSARTE